MAKLRISLTAGALWRSKIRQNLEKAKADILYETKSGKVELVEQKSFFESEFTFVVTELTDSEALILQKSFKGYFAKLKKAMA